MLECLVRSNRNVSRVSSKPETRLGGWGTYGGFLRRRYRHAGLIQMPAVPVTGREPRLSPCGMFAKGS